MLMLAVALQIRAAVHAAAEPARAPSVIYAATGAFRQSSSLLVAATLSECDGPLQRIAPRADTIAPAALLVLEQATERNAAADTASADNWLMLGCLRLQLRDSLGGATDPGDLLMPAGTSWTTGAVLAFRKALAISPSSALARRLLAAAALHSLPAYPRPVFAVAAIPDWVGKVFDDPRLGGRPPIRPAAFALHQAVVDGAYDRVVTRGCAVTMLMIGEDSLARECIQRALAVGNDSTWDLLRSSWLAFIHKDRGRGGVLFAKAIASARDSMARADIGWHFEQLHDVTPRYSPFDTGAIQKVAERTRDGGAGERRRWLALTGPVPSHWIRDRILARSSFDVWTDLIDLNEHFANLTIGVDGDFRQCVAKRDIAGSCFSAIGSVYTFAASRWRLWDTRDRRPISVVALQSFASVEGEEPIVSLDFRQWNARARSVADTAIALSMNQVTPQVRMGTLVVARAEEHDEWSLTQARPGRPSWFAGSYGSVGGSDPSGPRISDLVVSARPVTWSDSVANAFEVTPTLDHMLPLNMYLQFLAAPNPDPVMVAVAVVADGPDPTPVFSVTSRAVLRTGVNEFARSLDLSRVAPGEYQLVVTTRSTDGKTLGVRETALVIR